MHACAGDVKRPEAGRVERTSSPVAIIGAGPAGLAAAEILSEQGCAVTLHERMRTPGRKLLIAGRGGLNLTHSEPLDRFLSRYGAMRPWLAPAVEAFPPDALRAWAHGLGQMLFVGSSGRVFPTGMKASGLLRAGLARLLQEEAVMAVRRIDHVELDALANRPKPRLQLLRSRRRV